MLAQYKLTTFILVILFTRAPSRDVMQVISSHKERAQKRAKSVCNGE